MDSVNAMYDLSAKISQLKIKEAEQISDLRASYDEVIESISLSNILQSAFKSIVEIPGLKSTVLDTALSFGAGFVSKKLLVRNSDGFFRKIAGLATQLLVTNLVRNKIPDIKDKNNGLRTTDTD